MIEPKTVFAASIWSISLTKIKKGFKRAGCGLETKFISFRRVLHKVQFLELNYYDFNKILKIVLLKIVVGWKHSLKKVRQIDGNLLYSF